FSKRMRGITGFRLPSSTSAHRNFRAKYPIDRCAYRVDRGHAVHGLEQALFPVKGDEWRRLRPVDVKSGLERFRIVVRPYRPAPRHHLGDPAGQALEQGALVDLQLDDPVEPEPLLCQYAVERLRLRNSAGETVEDKSPSRVWLVNPVRHDRHHDVVGYQFAPR